MSPQTVKLALDIDGTITADPIFFASLARRVLDAGGEIHIVSSRSPESYGETVAELRSYGMDWNSLYLFLLVLRNTLLHLRPSLPLLSQAPHQRAKHTKTVMSPT